MNFNSLRPLPAEYAQLSERERALHSARMMFSQIWFEMLRLNCCELKVQVSPDFVLYVQDAFDRGGTPFMCFAVVGAGDELIPVQQITYTLSSFFPEMRNLSVQKLNLTSGTLVVSMPPRLLSTIDLQSTQDLEELLSLFVEFIFPERIARD